MTYDEQRERVENPATENLYAVIPSLRTANKGGFPASPTDFLPSCSFS
jgi:hypothetical protein